MKYNDNQRDNKSTGITAKLIKDFCDFFSEHYIQSINHRITEGSFIADFNKIEVRPLYKKDRRTNKSNYLRVPNNHPSSSTPFLPPQIILFLFF